MKKFFILVLTITLMLFATIAFAQNAATPANPGGLNFTGGTEATAFRFAGATSAGAKLTQSLDFYDWGATKTNHLSMVGYQFLAPTPGIAFYGAGARVDPDLSKVLSKTNVNSGQFGMFVEGAAGLAALPNKNNGIGFMVGGGVRYQITSALGWNSLGLNYLRLGSSNALSVSTGLTYIFK